MNDTNNAKSTIADKIHQAVSSLLDTETRLNGELLDARELCRNLEREIEQLRNQLEAEQAVRQRMERMISQIADVIERK